MTAGLYIVPGQVPRLDPVIDAPVLDFTIRRQPPASGPILSVGAVVQNLGLSPGQSSFVGAVLERAIHADNEVIFRQELMSSLVQERYDASLRRAILSRGVALYRGVKPSAPIEVAPRIAAQRQARANRQPNRQIEKGGEGAGAHLRSQIQHLVSTAGELGLPAEKLAVHTQKHGSKAVTDALRSLGARSHNHRIYIAKSDDGAGVFVKSDPEQMPRNAQSAGGDDPRSAPPGSRKIWNKRIVEKQNDGKWHVVGHVAGLEDPKAVQQLDTTLLTREQLLHLLQQLIHIHQAHNGKPGAKEI